MSCGTTDLPNHILESIFNKLPIATLIQCRNVCKTWQDITDLVFAKRDQEGRANLVLCVEGKPQRYWVEDVKEHYWLELQGGHNRHFDRATTSFNTWIGTKFIVYGLELVTSCNGLLCLCGPKMYIWNPITGEYISLPPIHDSNRRHTERELCGFGFSSKTNQFKAVRIHCGSDRKMRAEVYTLGTGTWRNIGFVEQFNAFLKEEHIIASNKLAHGCFYWVLQRIPSCRYDFRFGSKRIQIQAFDFDSEQFRSISLPPPMNGDHDILLYTDLSIGVFGDSSLIYLASYSTWKSVDVWVMNDDRSIMGTWTKTFIIEATPPECLGPPQRVDGISILENGEMLLVYYRDLWLYNPDTKSCSKVDLGEKTKSVTHTIFHRPSFASLKDIVRDSARVHGSSRP